MTRPRRRAGLAATVAALTSIAALAGCGGGSATTVGRQGGHAAASHQHPAHRGSQGRSSRGTSQGGSTAARAKLPELIGQHFMVRMESTASPELLAAVRQGRVGGVIVFPSAGAPVAELQTAIGEVRDAARKGGMPPPLVAVDQEGGIVKRFPDGPPFASPPQLGSQDDPALAEMTGADTGRFLRGMGINVDLAPVLDVPASQSDFIFARAFSADPGIVASVGSAFARGVQSAGVAATAKHFPGLGLATTNTDEAPSTIGASAAELRRGLEPFDRAIGQGIDMVMVSTAIYPTLGSQDPAAWSPSIVDGLLRHRLGFNGVVITDDLETPAVQSTTSPAQAAVDSLNAGADIALFAQDPAPAADAYRLLLEQVRKGAISRSSLRSSYRRILALKHEVAKP